MKKNVKLMCVALVLSNATMAQQATPTPVAAEQATAKRGTKIVFPPNIMVKVKTLGDVELISNLVNTTVNVIGTSKEGLILETKSGEKLLQKPKGPPRIIRLPNPPPIYYLLKTPVSTKLIGITDEGTAVWAGPDGKGGCTLDKITGKRKDYVGHVTLLR